MTNTNIRLRKPHSATGLTDHIKAGLATVEWSELSNRQRHFENASSEKSVGHRYPIGAERSARRPRTRCETRSFGCLLFVANCLSNQFVLSGKHYVREDR